MAAVPYAHTVANMLKDKRPKGTNIILAPNPKDIVSRPLLPCYNSLTPPKIWSNLNMSASELAGKKTMGWIYLVVVAFFNTIPLFIISIFANLSSVCASYRQNMLALTKFNLSS